MIKYIRTKDDVFIVEKENELYIWCYNRHIKKMYAKEKNNHLSCGCDYIGKYETANTIEELCDEFVYNNRILSEEDKNNKDYLSQLWWFNDVYGAIWTSKGLIYVAKMDDEGKLVLI